MKTNTNRCTQDVQATVLARCMLWGHWGLYGILQRGWDVPEELVLSAYKRLVG